MNTLYRSLAIISFFGVGVGLHGQINYKTGYIITSENDTVYGLINDGGGYINSRVCIFKENKKSEPVI